MAFQAVLFDLDGTLTDSLPLITRTYAAVFRELGLAWEREAVVDMVGLPLRAVARTFAGGREDEFVRLYQSLYFRDHDRLMRPFPWTEGVLTELAGLGFSLGVVTSKGRAGTMKTLDFLPACFAVVVTADDSPVHKPEAGPVLTALAALGTQAKDAAYIGDSPYDIKAGQAAGTFTAGVTWGASTSERLLACHPDAVFSRGWELADFFRSRRPPRPVFAPARHSTGRGPRR